MYKHSIIILKEGYIIMTKNENMIQTALIPEPKPLSIENLVIEVGRNCNLNCPHCLRGDANTSGMTNEIVDKIFENISYVQSLTITGGEPFLESQSATKISGNLFYILKQCYILQIQ